MPRSDGMGDNSGAWGTRGGVGTDALIQRIEIIERTRDNTTRRLRQMEQHFDGDCDLISRMDVLENQAMGHSVDKAVFDTKMTGLRISTDAKIDALIQEVKSLRSALSAVQDEMGVVHEELVDVQQGLTEVTVTLPGTDESEAIGDLRAELMGMRVKLDSAMTTVLGVARTRSGPARVAPQNDSGSDIDDGWGDDTPLDGDMPESDVPLTNGATNGAVDAAADHTDCHPPHDNGAVV